MSHLLLGGVVNGDHILLGVVLLVDHCAGGRPLDRGLGVVGEIAFVLVIANLLLQRLQVRQHLCLGARQEELVHAPIEDVSVGGRHEVPDICEGMGLGDLLDGDGGDGEAAEAHKKHQGVVLPLVPRVERLEGVEETAILVVEVREYPEVKANDPEQRVDYHAEDQQPEIDTQEDDAEVPNAHLRPHGPDGEHARQEHARDNQRQEEMLEATAALVGDDVKPLAIEVLVGGSAQAVWPFLGLLLRTRVRLGSGVDGLVHRLVAEV
mmetsp:Transcript_102138/g.218701  ORF Transcript_102138/g.218701 Transcript_102138/m.218701 type:complete len:265 (-) Transcript_102138:404-1198(-)